MKGVNWHEIQFFHGALNDVCLRVPFEKEVNKIWMLIFDRLGKNLILKILEIVR